MNFKERRWEFSFALSMGIFLTIGGGYSILTNYENLFPFVEIDWDSINWLSYDSVKGDVIAKF